MTTENEGAFRGSAVMPVGSSIDNEVLLDELELRLMRCSGANGNHRGTLRRGGLLAVGEHACAIARNETRGFWFAHRFERLSNERLVAFVEDLLTRPPRYLAWAVVPVFSELAEGLLSDDLVRRLVEWLTLQEPVERVVRDTIALSVVVKWLEQRTEEAAIGQLAAFCSSAEPDRARLGFVALASWLKRSKVTDQRSLDVAYAACIGSAKRVEPDIAPAVGWALRELLLRDGGRLIPQFERQVESLSRHTFRTAVERLPSDARLRLTKRWLESRRTDHQVPEMRHRRLPAS